MTHSVARASRAVAPEKDDAAPGAGQYPAAGASGAADPAGPARPGPGVLGPAGPGPGAAGQTGPGPEPASPGPGVVIAVDGPSGSGKSSAARGTALALGLRYLDTGAMYRAVAWWLLEHDIDVTDADSVAEVAPCLVIEISTEPGAQVVRVDGIDVTTGIRSRRVSNAVSSVASVPQVRGHLIAIQREIIGNAVATSAGIVAEGRDIGTVVAPDAAVKVFLTASEQVRAERRAAELAQRAASERSAAAAKPAAASQAPAVARQAVAGQSAVAGLADPPDRAPTADLTRIEQARRDRRDAPQTLRAADAMEIDATELGLDDVIERIVSLAASRTGAAWTS